MSNTILVWFRQDLRLRDNPALHAAASKGTVLPVYILDDVHAGDAAMGAASRWWLHHSLQSLDKSLGGKLQVFAGDPLQLIPRLMAESGADAIHWNRCYEPWQIKRDGELKQRLKEDGAEVFSHNGLLIWEPWTNLKKDETPYKVFTPFYRNGLSLGVDNSQLCDMPAELHLADCKQSPDKIDALELLPSIPWYEGFTEHFTPGESGAEQKLDKFLCDGIADYKQGRDYPAMEKVSRLSPHLHFGEISPQRVWQQAHEAGMHSSVETQAEHFQRELAWREFSYSLLYHFPTLTEDNMNSRFDSFPWMEDAALLNIWQKGETGYPLVDAGMRELWTTGYMHNRVRMVVGSFLVKNLMQHWQQGAKWFWDCLLDADLANNTCSWQWVAGCGADAAPYFRIFNPLTQSEKFEAAAYIKRYVPELAKLPDKLVHNPSNAPQQELEAAGIRLGKDYPEPVVDLKESRERALAAYKTLN